MATFEKTLSGKYKATVCINYKRSSRTCKTKDAARLWAAKQESVADVARGEADTAKISLFEVVLIYAETVSVTKRGAKWEVLRLLAFSRNCKLCRRFVGDVTVEELEWWRDTRLGQGVGHNTVRREFTLLSAVFQWAMKQKFCVKNPVRAVEMPSLPKHRERLIDDAERDALCAALGWVEGGEVDTHQKEIAVAFLVGLESCMRKGEIFGMTRRHVDFVKQVARLPLTKNGDSRDVPLSRRAVALLKSLPENGNTLFSVPTASSDVLFRRARARVAKMDGFAEIEEVHFHDARHTSITRIAQSGKLGILELARMTGHKDLKSLQTYFNASAASIAAKLD